MGGDSDDLVLNNLVELALASIREERPLFRGILEEPTFWRRHFFRWVKNWVEEEEALSQAQHNAMLEVMGIPNAI